MWDVSTVDLYIFITCYLDVEKKGAAAVLIRALSTFIVAFIIGLILF